MSFYRRNSTAKLLERLVGRRTADGGRQAARVSYGTIGILLMLVGLGAARGYGVSSASS